MRKIKATVLALGALVMMAPAANAGHMAKADCFQAIADGIKAKFAHLDKKIDAMHAWKMSKHKAHAAAPAPAKAKPAPKKVAAAKPMK